MMYDICDFGAQTSAPASENKRAIQRAIDAANEDGGGVVYVPRGVFSTGTLHLKSYVSLHISEGAVLLGSSEYEDYDFSGTENPWYANPGIQYPSSAPVTGLIIAEDAVEIVIEGQGRIDGNGQDHMYFPSVKDPYRRRPMLIFLERCENIRVQGVALYNPGKFAFLAARSKRIQIHNVYIDSWRTENGDGLDFNGSSDVTISDCIIHSGDDAISLKTNYKEHPCRNYTITNCIIESIWAAFRMGTESSGDMKDIAISNCVFKNCGDGLKIQDCSTGVYENVRISNIVMRDVHRPVFMTVNSYRLSAGDKSYRPELGGIRNVWIDGVTAYMPPHGADYQRNEFVVSGTEQVKIQDLVISNSRFIFDGDIDPQAINRIEVPEYLDYTFLYADVFSINGNLPSSGVFMRHVDGLRITNCEFIRGDDDPRPLVYAADVYKALLRDVDMKCSRRAFFHVDTDICLMNCTKNGMAFTQLEDSDEVLVERYYKFREITRETDKLFNELARSADAVEAIGNYYLVDDAAWNKTDACWTIKTELPADAKIRLVSYGDMQVFVNGKLAGVCRIDEHYRNMIVWTVEVGKYSCDGLNSIEIRFDDATDCGGLDCLLPFGEFRPRKPGLCAPMRIYSKML